MRPGVRAPFALEAAHGPARAGSVHLPRGSFTTPCFMPVGTRAGVKGLTADDVGGLGVQVLLANTYHLMLRPGVEAVSALGGLHGFMGWEGLVLTDSGGYQVFSLAPAVDDGGVRFRSSYDGSLHRLTPEGAVAVQEELGADVQMVLDVCPPAPAPSDVVRGAVERTAAWAARARAAHRRGDQALFGIVQGGTDAALRAESAARTVALDFDGYAIGGLSVGEDHAAMLDTLARTVPLLPADKPRYLMGVGDPLGLVEAVSLGVDLFDSVLPTRLARHGTVLTAAGRRNLRNVAFATDAEPLDPSCACTVCGRHSRAWLRHQLVVGDPVARRLVTLHNLAFLLGVVERTRRAVAEGTLDALRREIRAVWAPGARNAGGTGSGARVEETP